MRCERLYQNALFASELHNRREGNTRLKAPACFIRPYRIAALRTALLTLASLSQPKLIIVEYNSHYDDGRTVAYVADAKWDGKSR